MLVGFTKVIIIIGLMIKKLLGLIYNLKTTESQSLIMEDRDRWGGKTTQN